LETGWRGTQRAEASATWVDSREVPGENEGNGDQAKSNLKDAGEKVKDAFKK
jgi:hypothetical protein